jgi:hypothetical protein
MSAPTTTATTTKADDKIRIKGARQNNLKNLNLKLPLCTAALALPEAAAPVLLQRGGGAAADAVSALLQKTPQPRGPRAALLSTATVGGESHARESKGPIDTG